MRARDLKRPVRGDRALRACLSLALAQRRALVALVMRGKAAILGLTPLALVVVIALAVPRSYIAQGRFGTVICLSCDTCCCGSTNHRASLYSKLPVCENENVDSFRCSFALLVLLRPVPATGF